MGRIRTQRDYEKKIGNRSLKGGRGSLPQTREESDQILRESWECCNCIDAMQSLGKSKAHGVKEIIEESKLTERETRAALRDLRKAGLVRTSGTRYALTQRGRKAKT